MTITVENFVWCEKYRPKKIDDCILPESLKRVFKDFVAQGNIPNLLLSGPAGTGKTTVAKAMCNELGCDYIVINGSLNAGIDSLRNEIKNFASTVSFQGGRKIVILDEADYISGGVQAALRSFCEEFSKNCGFIFTCNFKNRIIEPLHSRCSVVEFRIPNAEKPKLAAAFGKRVEEILVKEGVAFNRAVIAQLVVTYFPDWRRCLNELQRYSACGEINSGILATVKDESFIDLVRLVKNKKWKEVRKWVAEHADIDPNTLIRMFYDQASEAIKPESLPSLVLLLADCQYKLSFSADPEICLMAFLTQVMAEIAFV